jgi:hypothetical protein
VTAFKFEVPSRARDQPETVARGFRCADAPARRRCTRFQILRQPQQQQRQSRIDGGELQPLAQFQIQLVDQASDGGRRARTQRFFHRPQRLFAVSGLDHDQTRGIKTESIETMTVEPAVAALSVDRHDKDERVKSWQAGQERHDKAEGGCRRVLCVRYDFMRGAAGEAAIRQTGIDGSKAEGKSCGYPR